MIKAILFDYDGVIVDSFANVHQVYQTIADHFGLNCPTDLEEFRKFYGYSRIECEKNLGILPDDREKVSEIFKWEIITKEHRIYPGIVEVIKNLFQDYKLYIVSAADNQEILKNVNKFNLNKYWQKVYSTTLEKKKGHIIAEILADNNWRNQEAIYIGDRQIDYDISKQAGLPDENIILVTYGWGLDLGKVGKSNIAHSPKEIEKIIKELK